MRTIAGLIEKFSNNEHLNILTAPTHERYQSGFNDINATFHMIQNSSFKDWSTQYAKVPDNHVLYPIGYIPYGVKFDLVLSQNKFGQYQALAPVSREINCPLISLEHTLPNPEWPDGYVENMVNMKGDVNIFISEFSRDAWGFKEEKNTIVVHHCVDTDLFKPQENNRENKVLCVVNDWINRDVFCGYKIFKKIEDGIEDRFTILGDTPGLSKPAKDIEDLTSHYARHRIFLNTSTVSPVPTALLEAMSSGCAVVSTATCMIPEIVENGVNGFISNDETELRSMVDMLINNERLAENIGAAARETILTKFNKENFTKKWNDVFQKSIKI